MPACSIEALLSACQQFYDARLVSVVIFGSVGSGAPHPDSDVDVLIVADGLPDGRLKRADEFRAIEDALSSRLADLREAGWHMELSPVFKTPAEILHGSPLLLDMIQDARLLCDHRGFFPRGARPVPDPFGKVTFSSYLAGQCLDLGSQARLSDW